MKHIVQVLGFSFLLVFSSVSLARGHFGGGISSQGMVFHLLENISLSDTQKAQIKLIRESEKAQIAALDIDRKARFKALKNLVQQPNFDELSVRELLTSYQAQELELKVIQLRAKNSLFNVLTTEQQEVLQKLMKDDKRKQRRHWGRN